MMKCNMNWLQDETKGEQPINKRLNQHWKMAFALLVYIGVTTIIGANVLNSMPGRGGFHLFYIVVLFVSGFVLLISSFFVWNHSYLALKIAIGLFLLLLAKDFFFLITRFHTAMFFPMFIKLIILIGLVAPTKTVQMKLKEISPQVAQQQLPPASSITQNSKGSTKSLLKIIGLAVAIVFIMFVLMYLYDTLRR